MRPTQLKASAKHSYLYSYLVPFSLNRFLIISFIYWNDFFVIRMKYYSQFEFSLGIEDGSQDPLFSALSFRHSD